MTGLAGWEQVAEKFVSSPTEQLFKARLRNYEQCVRSGAMGPGGVWTEVVLESLLAVARDRVDWPVRPAVGELPTLELTTATAVSNRTQTDSTWLWVLLPIPWVGQDGSKYDYNFPWPVLRYEEVGSYRYWFSATALWYLMPSVGKGMHETDPPPPIDHSAALNSV